MADLTSEVPSEVPSKLPDLTQESGETEDVVPYTSTYVENDENDENDEDYDMVPYTYTYVKKDEKDVVWASNNNPRKSRNQEIKKKRGIFLVRKGERENRNMHR